MISNLHGYQVNIVALSIIFFSVRESKVPVREEMSLSFHSESASHGLVPKSVFSFNAIFSLCRTPKQSINLSPWTTSDAYGEDTIHSSSCASWRWMSWNGNIWDIFLLTVHDSSDTQKLIWSILFLDFLPQILPVCPKRLWIIVLFSRAFVVI